IGPSLIQDRLRRLPFVLTEAPRGLPGTLPVRVVGTPQQSTVLVTYTKGALTMEYQGAGFPATSVSDTTAYAVLVVDDSTTGAGRADLRVAPPARGVPEHRLPHRARPDDARVRRAGGLGGRLEPEVPVARHTGGSPKLGAVTRIVAVSATRRTDAGRERVALNTAYVYALMRAGLVPLVVPPILDPETACAALDGVHGLVLTGGEDVEPGRYGAAPHPKLGETDRARDAVELALIAGAERRRLPILAICRGIQILNVALGGTLYQ